MRSILQAFLIIAGLREAATREVTYDERSFLFDGQREFILSGSVHPARVHPGDWPRVISLAQELGLNTLQVLFMWDEIQANATAPFVFTGKNDYAAFISLAGAAGLNVVARLGPYICGEWTNGGVPLWMRSEAACFRCSDPGWESHMATTLAAMVHHIEPLLASAGGPVIAMQVENEYSGNDIAYLTWAVATARNLTTAVPWLLCHDLVDCSAVNQAGYEVLCSINGFWYEQKSPFITQPSPVWAATQHANNPGQPLFWTEDQGWFDQWGVAQVRRADGVLFSGAGSTTVLGTVHVQFGRHTSDLLYGFARFTAYGLSAHNWYMLTGGSNWGLTAADAVTTAYAPDTAVDWLLLRHEPRFSAFKAWIATVSAISPALLGNPIVTAPTPLSPGCEASAYGPALAFLSNTVALNVSGAASGSATCTVTFRGSSFTIPPHTVLVVTGTGGPGDPVVIAFNTSAWGDDPTQSELRRPAIVESAASSADVSWEAYVEDFAFGAMSHATPVGEPPAEQLGLTNNAVDTMWYDQNVTVNLPSGNVSAVGLSVETCGGEYVYAFIDGVSWHLSGVASAGSGSHMLHEFSSPLGEYRSGATVLRVSLLVAAMGLKAVPISPSDCKGVVSSVLHLPGSPGWNKNTTLLGWQQRWVTAGDAARVFVPATPSDALPWRPVTPSWPPAYASSVWYRANLPTPAAPPAAEAPVPQLAVALLLSGMSKGVAYVNGWHLGRYNLETGSCGNNPDCAGSRDGCVFFYRAGACGKPTQTLYHVPWPVLNSTVGGKNLVVLFEETDAPPGTAPPAPPPPPLHRNSGGATLAGGAGGEVAVRSSGAFARNVSAVSLVVLSSHPPLD